MCHVNVNLHNKYIYKMFVKGYQSQVSFPLYLSVSVFSVSIQPEKLFKQEKLHSSNIILLHLLL